MKFSVLPSWVFHEKQMKSAVVDIKKNSLSRTKSNMAWNALRSFCFTLQPKSNMTVGSDGRWWQCFVWMPLHWRSLAIWCCLAAVILKSVTSIPLTAHSTHVTVFGAVISTFVYFVFHYSGTTNRFIHFNEVPLNNIFSKIS